jgi:hypothetical protein
MKLPHPELNPTDIFFALWRWGLVATPGVSGSQRGGRADPLAWGILLRGAASAFVPVKDQYFIIMSMAEASVDQAHDKVMGRIVNSIKAIE